MLLEPLYEPDARALKSGILLGRYVEAPSTTGSATSIVVSSSLCPFDRCRVVSSICVMNTAGAGQTSNTLKLEVIKQALASGGSDQTLFTYMTAFTAALSTQVNLTALEWILLANEYIKATVTFNSAVNANTSALNIIGYEFPKGNIV